VSRRINGRSAGAVVGAGLPAAPVTTEATLGAAWPDVPDERIGPLEQPLTRAIETKVMTGTRVRRVSACRLKEFTTESMVDPFEEVVKTELPISVAHGHGAKLPTTELGLLGQAHSAHG
jgi:hypothetical protein